MKGLKDWESWLVFATAPEAVRPRWFQRLYSAACIAESVNIAHLVSERRVGHGS